MAENGGRRVALDLETANSSELFRAPKGEFVRLFGLHDGGWSLISPEVKTWLLDSYFEVTGHNIMGFDGLALAWHHDMDWETFAAKARDTEIIARQKWPPRSLGENRSLDKYDMDSVAARLRLPGKTDDIKALARRHGGYGSIPQDDPDYIAYLEGDLRLAMALNEHPAMRLTAYTRREHELAAIAGRMTLNGFRVDEPLLRERLDQVATRKAGALQALHDGWGLPLSELVSHGRGKAKYEAEEPFISPLSTNSGREWLAGIWERFGVRNAPRTAGGKLGIGGDDVKKVMALPGCTGELREILELMTIVTGSRVVYETIEKNLAPDGRVHPFVSMRQASGRWSVTNPGLTVMGKHQGRHVERDVLIADEGYVLISVDLSQVDMRGIAGHCQDPNYIALFAPGRDAHAEIAVRVYGTKDMRQVAKHIGHGENYGLGARKMIREGLDPEMVYGFMDGMRKSFPRRHAWREMIRRQCEEPGFLLDNGFGRKMRCVPSRAYTAGPALMGQGTARDILAECLLRLNPEVYPYLQLYVHDEVIVSCPAKWADAMIRELKRAFTWEWAPPGGKIPVPILCEINGPGKSWGEISAKLGPVKRRASED
jgi:hypothetical protein